MPSGFRRRAAAVLEQSGANRGGDDRRDKWLIRFTRSPPKFAISRRRASSRRARLSTASPGAAHKALSSTTELPIVPPGAKDVTAKAFSFAEANVNAAFDLAQKLVKAKDPQEVFQLQADFVKSQFEAIQEQTKELGAAFQRSTTLKG